MDTSLATDAPEIARSETEPRTLLRFMTCGSVDDGKSTLIGRLLHDTGSVPRDQMETLEKDSKRFGTRGGELDFALLVDGLSAEREQGITIDVAFRYFATARRAFIVADTPGHEQYTRNMATGASNVELAIILMDATKGVLPQTRRHSFLVSMMRVRHVVLAVNKMDLVGFGQDRFDALAAEYCAMARDLGFLSVVPIPICARGGDNIATRSVNTPWYRGPTLLAHLESVSTTESVIGAAHAFAMPVQWVNRPDSRFRGYAGTVDDGRVSPGDRVRVLPSGRRGRIARIVTADGDLDQAEAGQAVTLTMAEAIDVSRGDAIVAEESTARAAQFVDARLLWMADDPLRPGRELVLRLGTAEASARVESIARAIDIHNFDQRVLDPVTAALDNNQIGDCRLRLDRDMVVAPYAESRTLGGFVLIDRLSHDTVALGVVSQIPHTGERDIRPYGPVTAAGGVGRHLAGGAVTFLAVGLLGRRWRLAAGAALLDRLAKILLERR